MKTHEKKTRIPMARIYREVAQYFRDHQKNRPSHTDVRCMVNDLLNSYEQGGFAVLHGYNQDTAYKRVRALLGDLE